MRSTDTCSTLSSFVDCVHFSWTYLPVSLASTPDTPSQNSLEVALHPTFRLLALAFPSPVSLSHVLPELLSDILPE